ncbi:MAG: methyltransferase domain-containing protein [Planctomycetota bacterium]
MGSHLRDLPHPLNLFEFVTGSHHYHLGLRPCADEELGSSMDRLLDVHLPRLRPAGRVLDVGCGMGGAVALFAARGFRAVGIDPCAGAVRYSRAVLPEGAEVELSQARLEDFEGAPVDAVFLTEVLQHFRDLDRVLARCRALLAPGGAVVVNDPVLHEPVSRERVPYHPAGALVAAAERFGFDIERDDDLTPDVVETLPRMRGEIERRRGELSAFFAARPRVDEEIDELLSHLAHFERGFADGYVSYRATVLRRPEQLRA